MLILVTGGAGFIGSNLVDRLVAEGQQIVIVDDFNDYYYSKFKRENIKDFPKSVSVEVADVAAPGVSISLIRKYRPQAVVHLAARAGVRASQGQPNLYVRTNVIGTTELLEASRQYGVGRFVFASSSSVYGDTNPPFSENHTLPHPRSVYAATKQAAEIIVSQYRMNGLSATTLRFFTVYGERGRPDMAPYLFVEALHAGKPFTIYGDGSQQRDFTYVGDIVDGIVRAIHAPHGYDAINLGNNHPVSVNEFVGTLEKIAGKKTNIQYAPARSEEMPLTWANIFRAKQLLGWQPKTPLSTGLERFYSWYTKTRA